LDLSFPYEIEDESSKIKRKRYDEIVGVLADALQLCCSKLTYTYFVTLSLIIAEKLKEANVNALLEDSRKKMVSAFTSMAKNEFTQIRFAACGLLDKLPCDAEILPELGDVLEAWIRLIEDSEDIRRSDLRGLFSYFADEVMDKSNSSPISAVALNLWNSKIHNENEQTLAAEAEFVSKVLRSPDYSPMQKNHAFVLIKAEFIKRLPKGLQNSIAESIFCLITQTDEEYKELCEKGLTLLREGYFKDLTQANQALYEYFTNTSRDRNISVRRMNVLRALASEIISQSS